MTYKNSVDDVTSTLLDRLNSLEAKTVLHDGSLTVIQLDASTIFRRLDQPIFLLIASYDIIEQHLSRDIRWLDRYITDLRPKSKVSPVLLTAPGTSRSTLDLIDKALLKHPVFDAQNLLAETDTIEALREGLLEKVSYELISPYRIDVCTPSSMFFGRRSLLKTLLNSQENQIIIGPRRIGKTSLVTQLQKELGYISQGITELRLSKSLMNKCSYVDVSRLGEKASELLWVHILRKFNLDPNALQKYARKLFLAARKRKGQIQEPDEASILDVLIARHKGELTIILDEVDGWFQQEAMNHWRTVDQLRAMTDEGNARVILVGYETLMAAAGNDRFPFASRGGINPIGPLEWDPIRQLVLSPLAEFKIKLQPEAQVLERIWQYTSGMPHLVQDICGRLVQVCLERKLPDRTVKIKDLQNAVEASIVYRDFRKGVINSNFPLAEGIAGLISIAGDANKGEDNITNSKIISELADSGYEYDSREFELAISYLGLRAIIRPLDTDRTRWAWVNQETRKAMKNFIDNGAGGYEQWREGIMRRHKEGAWKTNYRVLGRLN